MFVKVTIISVVFDRKLVVSWCLGTFGRNTSRQLITGNQSTDKALDGGDFHACEMVPILTNHTLRLPLPPYAGADSLERGPRRRRPSEELQPRAASSQPRRRRRRCRGSSGGTRRGGRQGLSFIHFSAQPAPFWSLKSSNETNKIGLTLSRKADECKWRHFTSSTSPLNLRYLCHRTRVLPLDVSHYKC